MNTTQNHLDFKLFANPIQARFEELANSNEYTPISLNFNKDLLWVKYLSAYPEELNTIFRERKYYDGSYDRHFVKRLGSVIFVKNDDLTVSTIWDIETVGYFQDVANKMKEIIKESITINNLKSSQLFYTTDQVAGNLSSVDNYDPLLTWDHFYAKIPNKYIKSLDVFKEFLGKVSTEMTMFRRSLDELSVDALEIVSDLIATNSIYRGQEFGESVNSFLECKKKYDTLSDLEKALFVFVSKDLKKLCRFKNSVIGTLVDDLSTTDLDRAVESYESKVAPENYKRTSAVVTQIMIKNAQATIQELGFTDSIYRRFATDKDISVENCLYVSTSKKNLNVFDDLISEAKKQLKKLDKVDEITIADFIEKVLPTAQDVSVLVQSKHKSNLVALTAPENESALNIFKWDNSIAWAYHGDVTDSITERVKHFGGKTEGALRISLSWHCADDLDLHLFEPDGNHIYYSNNRRSKSCLGGVLDLDMNGLDKKDSENPVENIIYDNMPFYGDYRVVVNNYATKDSKPNNFKVQVVFNGQTQTFQYDKRLSSSQKVEVLTIRIKNSGVEIVNVHDDVKALDQITYKEDVWGISTGVFTKVEKIMLSPNYWGSNKVGNKHLFFILEGCKSETDQRGFFNEYLKPELNEHRKVFEVLSSKTKAKVTNESHLAGIGFSETLRNDLIVKIKSNTMERTFKVLL